MIKTVEIVTTRVKAEAHNKRRIINRKQAKSNGSRPSTG